MGGMTGAALSFMRPISRKFVARTATIGARTCHEGMGTMAGGALAVGRISCCFHSIGNFSMARSTARGSLADGMGGMTSLTPT